jgi:hypothetical protein
VLRVQEEEKKVAEEGLDPWMLYLYATKSPATKEKYLTRLGRFLDFCKSSRSTLPCVPLKNALG